MCGIAGCYGFGDLTLLGSMTDAIAHRGPDGEYHFQDGPVLLGNRRLAIMDVADGHQPMSNKDGTITVIFNGEIYNFHHLRSELIREGFLFKTNCDTEVIPHLYEKYGLQFVERLDGIFSIALWDKKKQTLYLFRDPLGVKPLLFSKKGKCLAFGSEAKSILASGILSAELNPVALHQSMNLRYVPGEKTLFSGIYRLRPGHYLSVSTFGIFQRQYSAIDWNPDRRLTRDEWKEGIRYHLEKAVNRQMMSDVPIAVSLSGGIDSTTVLAMIRKNFSGDIQSFSLGFGDFTDEKESAQAMARHFGSVHSNLTVSNSLLDDLPKAIYFSEEPKVNCMQLYVLHRYIGQHVKVVLSGLGGDEMFGGYEIYRYLQWSRYLKKALPTTSHQSIANRLNNLASLLSTRGSPRYDLLARKLQWLGSIGDNTKQYLLLRNAWEFNRPLLDRIYHADFIEQISANLKQDFQQQFDSDDLLNATMKAEFNTKMVNDLLHNEDTMSMAHSVESRVPWLDLDFVRFTARIPPNIRFSGGMKGLLKEALTGTIPREALEKKKQGFTLNPEYHFSKALKPLFKEILSSSRFQKRNIFRKEFIQSILDSEDDPRLRWHYFMLLQMVGFEHWCNIFLEGERQ